MVHPMILASAADEVAPMSTRGQSAPLRAATLGAELGFVDALGATTTVPTGVGSW
jgi:hypothetical protein